MKRVMSALALVVLLAWNLQAGPPETPKPGLVVVNPPGEWEEILAGGGEGQPGNIIHAWSAVYEFTAVLQSVERLAPNEYRTVYVAGVLKVKNAKGAPWYNKKATEGKWFEYTGITVVNLTRKYTNESGGDSIEFSLKGYLGDRPTLFGSYIGPVELVIPAPPAFPYIHGAALSLAMVNAKPVQSLK